jgi:two-component system sensor histidine kinase KdpD
MMFPVSIASSLVHESAGHVARLGASGLTASLAAVPLGRGGKAAQRALPEPLASAIDHAAALSELTRYITSIDMHSEPGAQLTGFIRDVFAMEAVAIFDMDLNKTYTAGHWFSDPDNHLRNIFMFERSSADPETGLVSEVMRIGSLPIGSLLLRGEIDPSVVHNIANLIAITFDRYHSRANLSRVQSAREVERLRSTVLDSLAHTYKTPLTAIRAAATGVMEIGSLSNAQAELMAIIEEQCAALNELTMRLLTTARLEGHDLSLHTDSVAVAPMIDDAVSALRAQYPGLPVKINVAPEEIELVCDRSLISALLMQYLDNAGKYSEFESLVTVAARRDGDSLLLSVHNFGPVIPWSECERIFERYVRGAATAAETPGTGIGLSIARAAAQAHGGDAWVTSDETEGTTFWASLPMRGHDAVHE